jgi:hypothetical protein
VPQRIPRDAGRKTAFLGILVFCHAFPAILTQGREMRWVRRIVFAALFAGAACLIVTRLRQPDLGKSAAANAAGADPRLVYSAPYRNVRPEVKYVGDGACATCHPGQSSSYHEHPMARSMSLVSRAAPVERYDAASHNPFEKFGFEFRVEPQDAGVFHKVFRRDAAGKETLALAQEARYVVGSGGHGRAYLSTVDDYIFQTPVNWFSQGRRWDLAPNLGANHGNHFFRGVDPICIYCHGNQAEPVAGTSNRYRRPLSAELGIGCERCHGPGELHVQARTRGDPLEELDNTIVNPRRLEPVLREAICQQCHLHGKLRVERRGREVYDFRPGLPLHLFWSVFVEPLEQTGSHEAVSHVEQMAASKCFRASNGKMGCISCHDPHVYPRAEEKPAIYRQACLKCHQPASCPVSVQERKARNDDNCIACHMPRTRTVDVAHTATSDHRIPRRAGEAFTVVGGPKRRYTQAVPFVHFHEAQLDPVADEPERDLAVGLMDLAEPMPDVPERKRLAQAALPLLRDALENTPDDLAGLHAKGSALWIAGFSNEALACYEAVLSKSPEREPTLFLAAQLAATLGREETARSYWQRVIAVNPYSAIYRVHLGWLYARKEDWPRALEESRQALRLNPLNVDARKLLIEVHLKNGRRAEARDELQKLLLLDPDNAKQWRQRFEEMAR